MGRSGRSLVCHCQSIFWVPFELYTKTCCDLSSKITFSDLSEDNSISSWISLIANYWKPLGLQQFASQWLELYTVSHLFLYRPGFFTGDFLPHRGMRLSETGEKTIRLLSKRRRIGKRKMEKKPAGQLSRCPSGSSNLRNDS